MCFALKLGIILNKRNSPIQILLNFSFVFVSPVKTTMNAHWGQTRVPTVVFALTQPVPTAATALEQGTKDQIVLQVSVWP